MYPKQLLYKLYERAGNAEYNLGRGEKAKLNYNECLKHLDNAVLSVNAKTELTRLLIESIEKCNGLEEKKVLVDKQSIEKLIHGSHPVIPALSKFVKLQCSPTMGRGVFALEDINPGKYIIHNIDILKYIDNNHIKSLASRRLSFVSISLLKVYLASFLKIIFVQYNSID